MPRVSVGFATFSATLNISSSATVAPSRDNFSLVFLSSAYAITTLYDSGTLVSGVGANGEQGGMTNLYRKSATGHYPAVISISGAEVINCTCF